ncbi:MAG: nucleoside hydrolase [Alphaproteobacteria bacterium]|nr:nucleoside hydrolase [Alphaproteobacteria bacterium]
MGPTPLIIDCDPGVDDAVALLLAFASPDLIDILAVTTVGGNIDAASTARNARIIRQIAGREGVPVFAGAAAPLVRSAVSASAFHGETGLGDLEIFEPSTALGFGEAASVIADTVMHHAPGEVSIAVMGPMTNIALAMRKEPLLAARLRTLVVMGGAKREGGNITASAEYNFFADPDAADIVFRSGCRMAVIGLDATHQVRTTPRRLGLIGAINTPSARAAARLLAFAAGVEPGEADDPGPPLHDPCTIAYLLAPDLFTSVPALIRVETSSPLTLGHSAVEFRGAGPDAAVRWVTKVDAEGLFGLLLERLAR